MENISIVLFSIFILSCIWKFRESKWIKNFALIPAPGPEAKQNRDKLHQWGFIYNALLIGLISYAFIGLSWIAFLAGLTAAIMFWVLDMFLNIFIYKPLFYTGKTAVMDKVPILIRIFIFIALFTILILIV
jgi:hypothetical protein